MFEPSPLGHLGGNGVIDMELLSVIRRWHYRDHFSIREISRRTGLSRNTVRKYLRSDTVEPKFNIPDRPSKLDPYADKLSQMLRQEAGKSRNQNGSSATSSNTLASNPRRATTPTRRPKTFRGPRTEFSMSKALVKSCDGCPRRKTRAARALLEEGRIEIVLHDRSTIECWREDSRSKRLVIKVPRLGGSSGDLPAHEARARRRDDLEVEVGLVPILFSATPSSQVALVSRCDVSQPTTSCSASSSQK